MKERRMKILITGGAGFIGSHVVRQFVKGYPEYEITNLDALTYAGNLENIKDVENAPNYRFVRGDIKDAGFLLELFQKEKYDAVIHLAAESHDTKFCPAFYSAKCIDRSTHGLLKIFALCANNHLFVRDSIVAYIKNFQLFLLIEVSFFFFCVQFFACTQ